MFTYLKEAHAYYMNIQQYINNLKIIQTDTKDTRFLSIIFKKNIYLNNLTILLYI